MPSPFRRSWARRSRAARIAIAGSSFAVAAGVLLAAAAPPAAGPEPAEIVVERPVALANSPLDGSLFFQVLIGELQLSAGEAGAAYEAMLDAARKTGDAGLFRRATDIALQARAGDQALAAARAWASALPASADAQRYIVQLLVALNRLPEAGDALRSWIALTPEGERNALIALLPHLVGRTADPKASAAVLEKMLAPFEKTPESRIATKVALARTWLAAKDASRAFHYARQAHDLDGADDAPVIVAIEALPQVPAAEALIAEYLRAKPASGSLRMLYARALGTSQRYADAVAQVEQVIRDEPRRAGAWLTLGALQLELRHSAEATNALQTYLRLADGNPASADAESRAGEEPVLPEEARTQAWLMLAQAAEQQGDYAGAETWLARVDNPQRAIEVQQRRASLLAKRGRMAEARKLIRDLPERDDDFARAKFLAEAQLLRDAKQWAEARTVLVEANRRFVDDADLLYEQSMVDERLGRVDEMETLLRRVIAINPEHHHAHNALGYSLAERNVRLPEAKALIQNALEIAPGEPFITDSLGWVEYRLGNVDEALRLLQAAYRSRPDAEIGAHLGEVLWVSGRRDEARRILREARQRDAGNDVLRETLARLQADL